MFGTNFKFLKEKFRTSFEFCVQISFFSYLSKNYIFQSMTIIVGFFFTAKIQKYILFILKNYMIIKIVLIL